MNLRPHTSHTNGLSMASFDCLLEEEPEASLRSDSDLRICETT